MMEMAGPAPMPGGRPPGPGDAESGGPLVERTDLRAELAAVARAALPAVRGRGAARGRRCLPDLRDAAPGAARPRRAGPGPRRRRHRPRPAAAPQRGRGRARPARRGRRRDVGRGGLRRRRLRPSRRRGAPRRRRGRRRRRPGDRRGARDAADRVPRPCPPGTPSPPGTPARSRPCRRTRRRPPRPPEDAAGRAGTGLSGELDALATAASAAAATAAADLGRGGGDSPACTYVAAVVRGGDAVVSWIGDSRAYWLAGDGSSRLLSTDDSWAEEIANAGLMSREDAARDRRAHVLTRWLGRDAPERPGARPPRAARRARPPDAVQRRAVEPPARPRGAGPARGAGAGRRDDPVPATTSSTPPSRPRSPCSRPRSTTAATTTPRSRWCRSSRPSSSGRPVGGRRRARPRRAHRAHPARRGGCGRPVSDEDAGRAAPWVVTVWADRDYHDLVRARRDRGRRPRRARRGLPVRARAARGGAARATRSASGAQATRRADPGGHPAPTPQSSPRST